MDEFDSLRKLIALKRYETPGEAYFERFMDEFHQRQRAEMLKVPAHRLILDRCEAWLDGLHAGRWVTAAACAVAVICVAFSLSNPGTSALQADAAAKEAPTVSLLREF